MRSVPGESLLEGEDFRFLRGENKLYMLFFTSFVPISYASMIRLTADICLRDRAATSVSLMLGRRLALVYPVWLTTLRVFLYFEVVR